MLPQTAQEPPTAFVLTLQYTHCVECVAHAHVAILRKNNAAPCCQEAMLAACLVRSCACCSVATPSIPLTNSPICCAAQLLLLRFAALGTLMSRCTKLRDEQFIAAAEAVARLVNDDDRAGGATLPPLHRIREVSAHVARAVAQKAYEGGFATELPKPHSLYDRARGHMYNPQYRRYR